MAITKGDRSLNKLLVSLTLHLLTRCFLDFFKKYIYSTLPTTVSTGYSDFRCQPLVAHRSPPCSFFYKCILQGAIDFAEC